MPAAARSASRQTNSAIRQRGTRPVARSDRRARPPAPPAWAIRGTGRVPRSKRSAGGDAKARRSKAASATKSKTKKASPAAHRPDSKQALLIDLLRRKEGATIAEAVKATGWQPHSIRGAISGTLKRKLGLAVTSDKVEQRGRVYRIAAKR